MKAALLNIEVTCEDHLVLVRQRARHIAELVGFSVQDQTRIATAVSEVARNAFEHGGGGRVRFELEGGATPALAIRVTDDGPGMEEADLPQNAQWGIPGARRLMDQFELTSTLGEGTTVQMTKCLPPGSPPPTQSLVAEIGKELSGWISPNPIDEVRHQNQELLNALSEAKSAEKERERLIEDLKQTVRLNEMFVGVLGHDLRNPLTSVSMIAELLIANPDNDVTAEHASRILRSTQRMRNMIDQLLDFTRIRLDARLPLKREKTDIGALASSIIAEFQIGEGDASICYEEEGRLEGMWDFDRLAQALSNLIGNARKHGISERPIEVCIDGTNDDVVLVEVNNQGTIPADLLPVIFEPLRGDRSEEANTNGLGLGLFITKQIVQAHGGSIDVESNEAQGTTFTVRIPRTPSDLDDPPDGPPKEALFG